MYRPLPDGLTIKNSPIEGLGLFTNVDIKKNTFIGVTHIRDEHYCVANMPGGVPRTSTFALNKATLPFLNKLAKHGYKKALNEDKNFLAGLNVCKGNVTYKAVADIFGHSYVSPEKAIN